MKILAVDDNRDNIITYNALISHLIPDCKVYTAMTAEEAISKAKREQPDTILMDVKMPGMDGFEACRILKSEEKTKHIPIILITAISTDPESRIQGFEAGADSFIGKPIDESELAAQINVMLRIKKAEDKLREEKKNLQQIVEDRTKEIFENQIRMQNLIDNIPGIVYRCEIHPPWRMNYISKEVKKVTGYKPEEFTSNRITWTDVIYSTDRIKVNNAVADALGLGRDFSLEYRIIHKNGEIRWVHEKGRCIRLMREENAVLDGVIFDITERKKMEEALEISEAQYRTLAEDLQIGLYRRSINPGKIIEANTAFAKILGYDEDDELIALDIKDFYHDFEELECFTQKLKELGAVKQEELKLKRKNGSVLYCSVSAIAVKGTDGDIAFIDGIMQDITKQKLAQEKIANSLKEKEIMLAEIHHRVKNNLQVISSLLNMQAREIKDAESHDKFKSTVYRIRTMSMIHQKLYQQRNFDRIQFKDYIRDLTHFLYNAYKISPAVIKVNLDIEEDITFNVNQSIPFALILNELFSNSLEHAFPNNEKGEIDILIRHQNNKIKFEYSDNGVGFDEKDIDKDSLGISLIAILSDQLEAEFSSDFSNGVKYKFIF